MSMPLTSSNTSGVIGGEGGAYRGTFGRVQYEGTFSAGTVKLQIRHGGGSNWIDVPNSSFSAVTSFNIRTSRTDEIQAVITSADGSDSVTVTIFQIQA